MLVLPAIEDFKDPTKAYDTFFFFESFSSEGTWRHTYFFWLAHIKNIFSLQLQVALLLISLYLQCIGIMVNGFRSLLMNKMLILDICLTSISFFIGVTFLSMSDFKDLETISEHKAIFKFFCVTTVMKNLSVVKFMRKFKVPRIVLDVMYRSALFLIDLIGMLGIIMLFFSSIGITIFGGYVNNKGVPRFEEITGEPFDDGLEYFNFNDYLNSFMCLYSVILAGWQDFLRLVCFAEPEKFSLFHNYYFVAFFVIANMFLQNVLMGFIIDNIVAFLSEDFMQPGSANIEGENKSALKDKAMSVLKGIVRKTDRSKKPRASTERVVFMEDAPNKQEKEDIRKE